MKLFQELSYPAEPQKARVKVVKVAAIEARLASISVDALLHELAKSDELLTSPTDSTRIALVSYRQEAACGESGLTLDDQALLSAIATAKRGGVDALWLDAWCYRPIGEYNHEDFCETLSKVLSSVKAVVWLQRSKAVASGTCMLRNLNPDIAL